MILCANGASGSGTIGRLEWRSSDPQVVTVAPANLTVIHCLGERANAVLEARAPGTATVIVDELQGNTLVRTAAAALTVTASVE